MGLEVLLRVREPERSDIKRPIVLKLIDRHHAILSKDAAAAAPPHDDLASLAKPFSFDHIFDIDASQFSVYQYAQPLIASTFQQGGNTAILMYGESASGKTHTLVGGGNQRSIQQHPDRRGVIVRAAEDLFQMIKLLNAERSHVSHRVRLALVGVEAEKLTDMVAEQKGLPSAVFICEDPTIGTTITPKTTLMPAHSVATATGVGVPPLSGSNTHSGVLGNQYMNQTGTSVFANLQSHVEVSNMKEVYALINIFTAYRHKHPTANCIFTMCLDQIEMSTFPLAAHHAAADAFNDMMGDASGSEYDGTSGLVGASSSPKFALKCMAKLHFVEMPLAAPVAMQAPPTSELATPTGFFKERGTKSPARARSADKSLREVPRLDASLASDAASPSSGSASLGCASARATSRLNRARLHSGSSSTLLHTGTTLYHSMHTASASVLTRHHNSIRKQRSPDGAAPQVSATQARNISQAQDALTAVVQALHRLPAGSASHSHVHIPYRNSKLTHYLQDAFSIRGHSLFICTVRPTANHFDPTLVTLRFAQRMYTASHANTPVSLLQQTMSRNSSFASSSTPSSSRRRRVSRTASQKALNASSSELLQLAHTSESYAPELRDETVADDEDEDNEFRAAEAMAHSNANLSELVAPPLVSALRGPRATAVDSVSRMTSADVDPLSDSSGESWRADTLKNIVREHAQHRQQVMEQAQLSNLPPELAQYQKEVARMGELGRGSGWLSADASRADASRADQQRAQHSSSTFARPDVEQDAHEGGDNEERDHCDSGEHHNDDDDDLGNGSARGTVGVQGRDGSTMRPSDSAGRRAPHFHDHTLEVQAVSANAPPADQALASRSTPLPLPQHARAVPNHKSSVTNLVSSPPASSSSLSSSASLDGASASTRIPLSVAFPVLSPSVRTARTDNAADMSSDSGAIGLFTVRERARLMNETQDLLCRLQQTVDFLRGPAANVPDRVWHQSKNRQLDSLQAQVTALTQRAALMAQTPSISFGNSTDWEAELAEKHDLCMQLLDARQRLEQNSKDVEMLARYSASLESDTRLLATLTHRLDVHQVDAQRWRLDAAMWQRECQRLNRVLQQHTGAGSLSQQFENLQVSLQQQQQMQQQQISQQLPQLQRFQENMPHHHQQLQPMLEEQPQSKFTSSDPRSSQIPLSASAHVCESSQSSNSALPPVTSSSSGVKLASLTNPVHRSEMYIATNAATSSRRALSSAISALLRSTEDAATPQSASVAAPSAEELASLAASFQFPDMRLIQKIPSVSQFPTHSHLLSASSPELQQHQPPQHQQHQYTHQQQAPQCESITSSLSNAAISSAISSESDLVPSFERVPISPAATGAGSPHALAISLSQLELVARPPTAAVSAPWRFRLEKMSDSVDSRLMAAVRRV